MADAAEQSRLVDIDDKTRNADDVTQQPRPTAAPPPPTDYVTRWAAFVNGVFARFFHALGLFIATRPWTTIVLSLILSIALGTGLAQLEQEGRADKLWVPQNSDSIGRIDYVRDVYGRRPWDVTTIFTTTGATATASSDMALTVASVQSLMTWYTQLTAITTTATVDGVTYTDTLETLCYRAGGDCYVKSILDLWQYNATTIASLTDADILTAVNDDSRYQYVDGSSRVVQGRIMGGIKTSSTTGDVMSADVLRLQIYLNNDQVADDANSYTDARAEVFQSTITAKLVFEYNADTNNEHALTAASRSDYAENEAAGDAIGGDVSLFVIGYVIIITYCCVMVGKFDRVQSGASLALTGVLSVGMAVVAAFGLASYLGIFYGPVHSTLPFILLGIGVDDMFVIVRAFQEQQHRHPDMPVEEAVAKSLAHAGMSITITSVTDVLAFAIGSTTVLPALSSFCWYASLGILFDFLFQSTFFVACLTLDARRRQANRIDCCCCWRSQRVSSKSDADDDGDKDFNDPERGGKDDAGSDSRKSAAPSRTITPSKVGADAEGRQDHVVVDDTPWARFVTNSCGPMIMRPIVQVIIVCGCLAFFCYSIYAATVVRQDFKYRFFVPDDSYLQAYYDLDEKYFQNTGLPVAAYTTHTEYDVFDRRDEVRALRKSMSDAVYSNEEFRSWFAGYETWRSAASTAEGGSGSTAVTAAMPSLLSVNDTSSTFPLHVGMFLKTWGISYANDVRFVVNTTTGEGEPALGFLSTRITGFTTRTAIDDSEDAVDTLNGYKSVVSTYTPDTSLSAFAFSFLFIFFEQFEVIRSELIRNIGLSLVAVFFVTLGLIAHPVTSILVFVSVSMVMLDMVGMIYFTGININVVSVINLVVTLGLAVDYCAHIGHAFMLQRHGTRQQRAVAAVASIGGSVLNGAVSTFLAVLVLAFTESYVFQVFFKMLSSIVIMGAFHGLVLLPILLARLGPKQGYTAVMEQL